jgi:ribonuclease P protein component
MGPTREGLPAGDPEDGPAGDPPPSDQRFPRTHRLCRREDFLRVQREGTRVHTRHYVIVVLPRSEGGVRRLGITVTRKIAGAVGRNRVKRVLREVFRRNRSVFPPACDLVVIAKSGAPELGYEAVLSELARVRGPMANAARSAAGGAA